MEEETTPQLRFLNLRDVLGLIPVSKRTLYRMVDDGKFPMPLKLGTSPDRSAMNVWIEQEVIQYMNQRIELRGKQ